MALAIIRFGAPSREMLGIYQAASGGAHSGTRYMLCRPMGQEAVRTSTLYRVVSDRLAREGCDVLRFDYHGTGDSPGEEKEQSLAEWENDTLAAHNQLHPGNGTTVNWFGMGLGATLALRAASRATEPPAHIVLWEPVLDGREYASRLLQGHKAELAREFGEPWDRLLRAGKVAEPTLPGDVLGFEMGPQLATELQQLGEVSIALALRRGIRVTCAVHPEQRPLFQDLEQDSLLRIHVIETRTNWLSSQAMATAIVPPDLTGTLLATLR